MLVLEIVIDSDSGITVKILEFLVKNAEFELAHNQAK